MNQPMPNGQQSRKSTIADLVALALEPARSSFAAPSCPAPIDAETIRIRRDIDDAERTGRRHGPPVFA